MILEDSPLLSALAIVAVLAMSCLAAVWLAARSVQILGPASRATALAIGRALLAAGSGVRALTARAQRLPGPTRRSASRAVAVRMPIQAPAAKLGLDGQWRRLLD